MDPSKTTVSVTGLNTTPVWNGNNTQLTLEHDGLKHGTTYNLTVNGVGLNGLTLGQGLVPSQWSFTTTTDNILPTVTIQIEGESAGSIPVDATITLAFSEPIRRTSLGITLRPYLPGYFTWSDDSTAVFHLLQSSTEYERNVPYTFTIVAAKDLAGNELASVDKTFTVTGLPVDDNFTLFLPDLSRVQ